MRSITSKLHTIIVLLPILALATPVYSYEQSTHRLLTIDGADFASNATNDPSGRYSELRDPATASRLSDGAHDEDNGARSVFHFCDGQDGLRVPSLLPVISATNARKWGLGDYGVFPAGQVNINTVIYPSFTFPGWNQHGFRQAIQEYHAGHVEDAYYSLGYVVHLIEDMAQPDHSHAVPHIPHGLVPLSAVSNPTVNAALNNAISVVTNLTGIGGRRAKYEEYVADREVNFVSNALNTASSIPIFTSFSQAIDMAQQQGAQYQSPADAWSEQYDAMTTYGCIDPFNFSLACYPTDDEVNQAIASKYDATAETLLPRAIENAAGMMRFFHDIVHCTVGIEGGGVSEFHDEHIVSCGPPPTYDYSPTIYMAPALRVAAARLAAGTNMRAKGTVIRWPMSLEPVPGGCGYYLKQSGDAQMQPFDVTLTGSPTTVTYWNLPLGSGATLDRIYVGGKATLRIPGDNLSFHWANLGGGLPGEWGAYSVGSGDPTFIQPSASEPIAVPATAADTVGKRLVARISTPRPGNLVRATVPVIGLAMGDSFARYTLEYGQGSAPETWTLITSSADSRVEDVIPQNLTSGDLSLYGNLGTFQSGLVEYDYPFDTWARDLGIDGPYTLRLRVEGTDSAIVEDSVTVTVGRVVGTAFNSAVASSDGKVSLDVPALSFGSDFRVLTIRPTSDLPAPLPEGAETRSLVYEILPGAQSFGPASRVRVAVDGQKDSVAIFQYHYDEQLWMPLPRFESETEVGGRIQRWNQYGSTRLVALHAPGEFQPAADAATPPPVVTSTTHPMHAGSSFSRDNTFDGASARSTGTELQWLRLLGYGGPGAVRANYEDNRSPFAVTLTERPFDANDFPLVRFAIHPDGPAMNLFVRQGNDWREVFLFDLEDPALTGPGTVKRDEQKTGIAQLGTITPAPGVILGWWKVEMNLAELLRSKGFGTRVDEVALAAVDWKGYRRLVPPPYARGNEVMIDEFAVYRAGGGTFEAQLQAGSPATVGFAYEVTGEDQLPAGPEDLTLTTVDGALRIEGLSGRKVLSVAEIIQTVDGEERGRITRYPIFADAEPPPSPVPRSFVFSKLAPVVIPLRDTGRAEFDFPGIDPASIRFSVNGQTIPVGAPSLTFLGWTGELLYQPEYTGASPRFADGEQVTFRVEAADEAGNAITPAEWIGTYRTARARIEEVVLQSGMKAAEVLITGPVDLKWLQVGDLERTPSILTAWPQTYENGVRLMLNFSEGENEDSGVGDLNENGLVDFYAPGVSLTTNDEVAVYTFGDTRPLDAVCWNSKTGQSGDVTRLQREGAWSGPPVLISGTNRASISRRNADDHDLATDWEEGAPSPGRAGLQLSQLIGKVLLTEFHAASRQPWAEIEVRAGPLDISSLSVSALDGDEPYLASRSLTLQTGERAVLRWNDAGVTEVDGVGDTNGNGVRDIYVPGVKPASAGDQIVLRWGYNVIDAVSWGRSGDSDTDMAYLHNVLDSAWVGAAVETTTIGFSFGRVPGAPDHNTAADWILQIVPTPGRENIIATPPPAGALLVNEVSPDRALLGHDWVELLAVGQAVNLQLIQLTDLHGDDGRLSNEPLTMAAGERAVVHFNPGIKVGLPVAGVTEVDAVGDVNGNGYRDIYLNIQPPFITNHTLALTSGGVIVDAVRWSGRAYVSRRASKDNAFFEGQGIWEGDASRANAVPLAGRTICRYPDGQDGDRKEDWIASLPTPGAPNVSASDDVEGPVITLHLLDSFVLEGTVYLGPTSKVFMTVEDNYDLDPRLFADYVGGGLVQIAEGMADAHTYDTSGRYTIRGSATDFFGNEGAPVERDVFVDADGPVIDAGDSIYLPGQPFALRLYDSVPVARIEASIQDSGSGYVFARSRSLSESAIFSAPDTPGRYTLKIAATDVFGNRAELTTIIAVNDSAPPDIRITRPVAGNTYSVSEDVVEVEFAVVDPADPSPTVNAFFRFGDESGETVSVLSSPTVLPASLFLLGEWSFHVQARDWDGNEAQDSVTPLRFVPDVNPPLIRRTSEALDSTSYRSLPVAEYEVTDGSGVDTPQVNVVVNGTLESHAAAIFRESNLVRIVVGPLNIFPVPHLGEVQIVVRAFDGLGNGPAVSTETFVVIDDVTPVSGAAPADSNPRIRLGLPGLEPREVLPISDPGGVALSPDGELVAVTQTTAPTVVFILADSPARMDTVSYASGGRATGVSFSADGRRLYVADGQSKSIVILDVATRSAVDSIALPTLDGGDYEISLSPAGGRLFVSVTGANSGYFFVDPVSRVVTATRAVANGGTGRAAWAPVGPAGGPVIPFDYYVVANGTVPRTVEEPIFTEYSGAPGPSYFSTASFAGYQIYAPPNPFTVFRSSPYPHDAAAWTSKSRLGTVNWARNYGQGWENITSKFYPAGPPLQTGQDGSWNLGLYAGQDAVLSRNIQVKDARSVGLPAVQLYGTFVVLDGYNTYTVIDPWTSSSFPRTPADRAGHPTITTGQTFTETGAIALIKAQAASVGATIQSYSVIARSQAIVSPTIAGEAVDVTLAEGASPDSGIVYALNQGGQYVSILDASTFEVMNNILLPARGEDIAVDPSGRAAIVTLPTTNHVAILDLITPQVRKLLATPSASTPKGVALSSDGQYALVTLSARGSIMLVDMLNETTVLDQGSQQGEEVLVSGNPKRIAVSPDDRSAFVIGSGRAVRITNMGSLFTVGPNTAIEIVAADRDDKSPIVERMVSIDGEPYTSVDGSFTLGGRAEGPHQVVTRARDIAGNLSDARPDTIILDASAPVVGASAPVTGARYVSFVDSLVVYFSVTDNFDPTPEYSATLRHAVSGASLTVDSQAALDPETLAAGDWTLTIRTEDFVGNTAETTVGPFTVTHDLQPPRTWIEVGAPVALGGTDGVAPGETFVAAASLIAFTVYDDRLVVGDSLGVGAERTLFAVDAEPDAVYSGAFTLNGRPEGVHSIRYSSIDRDGNTETAQSVSVRLDRTPPEISVALESPRVEHSGRTYISAATTVVATALDRGVGLASFDQPTGLLVPGENTLTYRAADLLGLVSETSVVVTLDAAAPGIAITLPVSGATYRPRLDSVVISFSVIDNYDPLPTVTAFLTDFEEGTVVQVQNGDRIEPLTLDDGQWQLTVNAQDWLGNVSQAVSGAFTVVHDVLPPRTSAAIGTPSRDTYIAPMTPVTFSAVDDLVTVGDGVGLGVARTEFRVDLTGAYESGMAVRIAGPEGVHTIEYRSVDALGNIEATKTLMVYVDSTAPHSTLAVGAPSWTSSAPFDRSGNFSGVVFDSVQAAAVLEMVNRLSLRILDDEMLLAADEARNIVAARAAISETASTGPIVSLSQLDAVSQIGASALRALRDSVPVYLTYLKSGGDISSQITFTPAQVGKTITFANTATSAQLQAVSGIGSATATTIINGRPYADIPALDSRVTTTVLRNLRDYTSTPTDADTSISRRGVDGAVYVRPSTVLTVSAVDSAAGVGVVRTAVDATATESLSVRTGLVEAIHLVRYRSEDVLGNRETPRAALIASDSTAPSISLAVGTPTYAAGGSLGTVVTSATPITATALDPALPIGGGGTTAGVIAAPGAGVASITRTSITGQGPVGPLSVSGEFTLTSSGTQSLRIEAADRVDNIGAIERVLTVDDEAPVIVVQEALAGRTFVQARDSIPIVISVSDLDSNASFRIYLRRTATGETSTVSSPSAIEPGTLAAGAWSLVVAATDWVGNSRTVETGPFEVVVDALPPRTTAAVGAPTALGGADGGAPGESFVTSASRIDLAAVDDLATVGDGIGLGVLTTEYALDGASYVAGTSFTISGAEGRHAIIYRSADIVGHVEETRALALHVDNTAPTSRLEVLAPFFGSDVVLDRSDTVSDVYFDAAQAAAALEMVNDLSVRLLDDEVGLASDAIAPVIAARPIMTLDQLDAVAQIGPSALQSIRDFIPIYTTYVRPGGDVASGVTFTAAQVASTLSFVNTATTAELQQVSGIGATTASAIVSGRVFSDVAALDAVVTSTVLRNLRDYTPTLSSASDSDGDGIVDSEDNAPFIPNPDQSDIDGDGIGDVADIAIVVEGVEFTEIEAAAVLSLANTGSDATLQQVPSVDAVKAGNIIAARPFADLTALGSVALIGPETLRNFKLFVGGSPAGGDGLLYVSDETLIRAEATDLGSGVNSIRTDLDNAGWSATTERTAFQEGLHMLAHRSSDRLGHEEPARLQIFAADNTAPAITITVGSPSADGGATYGTVVAPTTDVSVSAVDSAIAGGAVGSLLGVPTIPGSGLATLTHDASGVQMPSAGVFHLTTPGTRMLRVEAEDWVENRSVLERRFTVDGTAPTIAITAPVAGAQYAAGLGTIPIAYTVSDDLDPAPTSAAALVKVSDSTTVPVTNGSNVDPGVLSPGSWRLRVNAQDFAANTAVAFGGAFEVLGHPLAIYVNDGSTAGDVFTTAVGNDANTGLSPSVPKRTLASVAGILQAGDSLFIDAGDYFGPVRITRDGVFVTGADSTKTVINGGMIVENAQNVVVQRLQVRGATIGLEFFNTQYSVLRSVTSRANGLHGVKLNSNCNYNTVEGCLFTQNGQYGIDFWGASYNDVSRNVSVSNAHGFFVERYCYENVFAGNRASFNRSHGFAFDNAFYNTIRNSIAERNDEFGALFAASSGSNTCRQNTFFQNKTGAAYIGNSTSGALFTNNNMLLAPDGNGTAVYHSTPNIQDFTHNWWGSWDEAEIYSHIRGSNPNGVVFIPYRLGEIAIEESADTVAPGEPTNVQATLTPDGLEISWLPPGVSGTQFASLSDWLILAQVAQPNADVQRFNIYYTTPTDTQHVRLLATVPGTATSYLDAAYHPLTRATYMVTAADAAPLPNESFFSVAASITPDLLPPRTMLYASDPKVRGAADGSAAGETFVTSASTVTLQAEDDRTTVGDSLGYGVVQTKVAVDGGAEADYAGPISFGGFVDGAHSFTYRSTDRFGTAEVAHTDRLYVDNTGPTTVVSVGDPQRSDSRGLFVTPSTPITFTDHDAGVGLAEAPVSVVTVSTDGAHTITHRAVDLLGNATETGLSVVVDGTPPVVTILQPESGTLYLARRDSIVIAFTATDATDLAPTVGAELVDVEEGTRIVVSSGDIFEPLSLDDGFWRLEVSAADWLGNTAAPLSVSFQVLHDVLPPRTEAAVGAPLALGLPDGSAPGETFVTSATPITLTAVDDLIVLGDANGLGVAATEYAWNEADYQVGSAVTLTGTDGAHTLRYRSIDVLGNTEDTRTLTFRLDNAAPVVTQTVSGPSYVDHAGRIFGTSATTLALSALDTGVGVASFEIAVDANSFVPYSTELTFSNPGEHQLTWRAVDGLGQVAAGMLTFVTDDAAPGVSISVDITDTTGRVLIPESLIALATSDATAGVAELLWSLDTAPLQPYTSPFEIGSVGFTTHTLTVRATDRVGNVTETTFAFRLSPALEVTKSLTLEPRTLVWWNYEVAPAAANGRRIEDVVSASSLLYETVTTREAFVAGMRSGRYNVYVVLGDRATLEAAEAKELGERVNLGAGLVASRTWDITGVRLGHDMSGGVPSLARDNVFGVKVTGTNPAEDAEVQVLAGFADTLGFQTATEGKAPRIQEFVSETIAVYPGEESSVAGTRRQYGLGRTVYLSFDIAAMADEARISDVASILGAALGFIRPDTEPIVAGGVVAVRIGVKSLVVPLDLTVSIEELVPSDVNVTHVIPSATVSGGALVWTVLLDAGEETTVSYAASLPDEEAMIRTDARILYLIRGLYRTFGSVPLDVRTRPAADHLDAAAEDIRAIIPRVSARGGDRARVEAAQSTVESLTSYPPSSAGQYQTAVDDLLKAIEDLTRIEQLDVQDDIRRARMSMDAVVIVYALSGGI